VDVTVIDRTNHHLFAPLLYQVATGLLSPGEIAPALRKVLRRQHNTSVLLGEVTEVDLDARQVEVVLEEAPSAGSATTTSCWRPAPTTATSDTTNEPSTRTR
jgi:NADH dehydrogenase FAD-containing subunit